MIDTQDMNKKEILEILSLTDEELELFIKEHEQMFEVYLSDEFGLEVNDTKEFVLQNVIDNDIKHPYKTAVILQYLL